MCHVGVWIVLCFLRPVCVMIVLCYVMCHVGAWIVLFYVSSRCVGGCG